MQCSWTTGLARARSDPSSNSLSLLRAHRLFCFVLCTNELIKDDDGPQRDTRDTRETRSDTTEMSTEREQLLLEVLLGQASARLGLPPVGDAVRLVHHALQHALLARIQLRQVDVPRGPELAAVVQMLVLQAHVVPDEASRRGERTGDRGQDRGCTQQKRETVRHQEKRLHP